MIMIMIEVEEGEEEEEVKEVKEIQNHLAEMGDRMVAPGVHDLASRSFLLETFFLKICKFLLRSFEEMKTQS